MESKIEQWGEWTSFDLGQMKKWFQPKITFLPIEQEGNIWRYLCSIQTCDFKMLPDVTCAPGDLTELGRKCGKCCLSHTRGGLRTSKNLHKSRCINEDAVRAGSGVSSACLSSPPPTGDKAGWTGENQIPNTLLISFLLLFL